MNGLFFLLMLFAISTVGWMPMVLTQAYCCMSAVTFVLYGIDKLCAVKDWRRISEKTLHLYALIGGWPGANMAQDVFRHKVSKSRFRRVYYLTIIINLIVLIVFLKFREFVWTLI